MRDEPQIERRITFQYGVNSPRTRTGFASYDELIDRVRQETMGEIDVLKREERIVTYTEWEPEVTDEEYVRRSERGGWLLSDKAVADVMEASE